MTRVVQEWALLLVFSCSVWAERPSHEKYSFTVVDSPY